MQVVYILCLGSAAAGAAYRRLWWMAAAMATACLQAVLVASGSPADPGWLARVWLPGEAVATAAAGALTVSCVLRETESLVPFRRLALRMAAGSTGVAIAGLVWIHGRYESFYWIFVAARARIWLASAVALSLVAVFVAHTIAQESRLALALALAHALTAPFPRSQPVFRMAVILACSYWLQTAFAGAAHRAVSRVWRRWQHKPKAPRRPGIPI